MNAPPDYSALKAEEMVHEEKLSADERELIALQKAEMERDAERMRLDRIGQQREMQKEQDQKAATAEAGQAAQSGGETVAHAGAPSPLSPAPDQLQKLLNLKNTLNPSAEEWAAFFAPYGVAKAKELTPQQAEEVIAAVTGSIGQEVVERLARCALHPAQPHRALRALVSADDAIRHLSTVAHSGQTPATGTPSMGLGVRAGGHMSPMKKSPVGPSKSRSGVTEKCKKGRSRKRPGRKSLPSKAALAWAAERDAKTLCACGCGSPIRVKPFHRSTRGVPKFVHGHTRSGSGTPTAKWVRQHQGKHVCQCGCGGLIQVKRHHRTAGLPRFLHHHASRVIQPMRGRIGPASPHFKGGRRRDDNGYILIFIGSEGGRTRYCSEHRLIMEQALGRKLRKGETVHHKNGRRDDNRLANLELWKSKHPGGQRVQDLLAFAVSVIRDHAGDRSVWPEGEADVLRRMAEALKKCESKDASSPSEVDAS